MNGITIYEYDALTSPEVGATLADGLHIIPANVYEWLEVQCLMTSEEAGPAWLRLGRRRGRRVVQVTSYVGVIRAPSGFQIEVLPKVGKVIGGGATQARRLLIEMLSCLQGFRHIETDRAHISAARMPLLELFIAEFLRSVAHIVKHGLYSGYSNQEDNLFALRGKLDISRHLRENLCRRDRFFARYDEFSIDRAENRLIHAALLEVLSFTKVQAHQRLGQELCFVFADVPPSKQIDVDFQKIRLDRGMNYYKEAIEWSRLILGKNSPLTGMGQHVARSLLFPMEFLFEAYVAKHLSKQLRGGINLKAQTSGQHLVTHKNEQWFRLRPDYLVQSKQDVYLLLDAKWKLLDSMKGNGCEKYQLSQTDFYQLFAYGHHYLKGKGDMVLIYPKTDNFMQPLPVFDFPQAIDMRLWVLPFCFKERKLIFPNVKPFERLFYQV